MRRLTEHTMEALIAIITINETKEIQDDTLSRKHSFKKRQENTN